MTYSVHFRKKVLLIKEKERLSLASVSKRFAISKNTVFLWTKTLLPRKHRAKPAIKIDMQQLQADIAQYSDAYQYERAERLNVSQSAIHSALKRLKVTYKKNFKTSKGQRRREARI
ncbi:MAG: IS630 transposase-related protein [Rickettsiaceae bacterium]